MKINSYRYLNTNGAILDKEQLKNYMKKLAVDYEIKENSDNYTYPIFRLKSNYKFIEKTYNVLNQHVKANINIHPAGEWLLDNFYLIDELTKIILKDINSRKYQKLPGIAERRIKRIRKNLCDCVKNSDIHRQQNR